VLLYDLTSTYFESPPPADEADKRRHGYSRDKRSDCVQVVIALIVTPEGFPLGYEVLPGNTADCTTLRDMLRKIEAQYGKANRIWVMDCGIPTEEVLAEVRAADPPIWSAPPRGGCPSSNIHSRSWRRQFLDVTSGATPPRAAAKWGRSETYFPPSHGCVGVVVHRNWCGNAGSGL
jgi:hypothetical protein